MNNELLKGVTGTNVLGLVPALKKKAKNILILTNIPVQTSQYDDYYPFSVFESNNPLILVDGTVDFILNYEHRYRANVASSVTPGSRVILDLYGGPAINDLVSSTEGSLCGSSNEEKADIVNAGNLSYDGSSRLRQRIFGEGGIGRTYCKDKLTATYVLKINGTYEIFNRQSESITIV